MLGSSLSRWLTLSVVLATVSARSADACSQASARVEDDAPLFLARASSAHSYVDPKLGVVMTEYTAVTVECLTDECPPTTTVVVVGGEVGDLVTRVAGVSYGVPSTNQLFVFRSGKLGRAHPFDARRLTPSLRSRLDRSPHVAKIASLYFQGSIQ
jgi:hypothetical protein